MRALSPPPPLDPVKLMENVATATRIWLKSGRPGSNRGPPAPKAGALPLRHAPTLFELGYRACHLGLGGSTAPICCSPMQPILEG